MKFTWKILEVFSENENISKVKYLLKVEDEQNTVETEGYHSFHEGTIVKPYSEIKEEDLTRWVEQDTTQNEVNIIKSNLENQLKALKTSIKNAFPWETDTFTIG